MDALDGNAIAGLLVDAFGTEMTTSIATCANCGVSGYVGECAVYLGGPGVVVRCPHCQNVVLVLVQIRGRISVDAMGLTDLRVSA